ncbi:MAG: hypothetical protein HFJ19_04750 [Clostridia bacterium]|nr:hypothetical protein [Clostridia bacterium]
MSRGAQKLLYTFDVKRNKKMRYEIDLDENGNIVSVSKASNVYRGRQIIKSECRTQDQGDEDFESFLTKCLREIFRYVNASDLIEALNEKMLQKYFKYVPK